MLISSMTTVSTFLQSPVSSQLVKLVGAQLAVPGAVTVFHGQVEGPVDGQAADVEGGHTCRSH